MLKAAPSSAGAASTSSEVGQEVAQEAVAEQLKPRTFSEAVVPQAALAARTCPEAVVREVALAARLSSEAVVREVALAGAEHLKPWPHGSGGVPGGVKAAAVPRSRPAWKELARTRMLQELTRTTTA